MISKKALKVINEELNSYTVALQMYDDAKGDDSKSLWASCGLKALEALDVYGIKPSAGSEVMRNLWQSAIRIAA